jgi:hypothetical protein
MEMIYRQSSRRRLMPNAGGEQRPTCDNVEEAANSLLGGSSDPVACSVRDVPSSIV